MAVVAEREGEGGRKGGKRGAGTGKWGGDGGHTFRSLFGLLNRPYFRVPQAPECVFYEGFGTLLTAVLLSLMLAFLTS